MARLKPVPPAGVCSQLLQDHQLMPTNVPACQSRAGTVSLLQNELYLLLLQPRGRLGGTERSSVCSTDCCSGPKTEVVGRVWLPPAL